jgi:Flp pilus assembly pilin Flp
VRRWAWTDAVEWALLAGLWALIAWTSGWYGVFLVSLTTALVIVGDVVKKWVVRRWTERRVKKRGEER